MDIESKSIDKYWLESISVSISKYVKYVIAHGERLVFISLCLFILKPFWLIIYLHISHKSRTCIGGILQ